MGETMVQTNKGRFRVVHEAFGGIKYMKLIGKEEVYLDHFKQNSLKFCKSIASHHTISLVPNLVKVTTVAITNVDPSRSPYFVSCTEELYSCTTSDTLTTFTFLILLYFFFLGALTLTFLDRVSNTFENISNRFPSIE